MRHFSQEVLEAIAGGVTRLADIMRMEDMTPRRADNAVQVLRRRQFIVIERPGQYRITEAGMAWLGKGRAVASGQGKRSRSSTRGLRERAWWLMRAWRKFTLADLLTTLADGSERDATSNLGKYLAALGRAGIVKRLQRRSPGLSETSNGHVIWWLAKDIGPAAPVWRQAHKAVYDPNSGQLFACEGE